jgi:hypothetical protein
MVRTRMCAHYRKNMGRLGYLFFNTGSITLLDLIACPFQANRIRNEIRLQLLT